VIVDPREAVERQRLIVVCGPGGVGKTTTSAAFGLAAARHGRRVLVITIDPAKRLGEALGEEGLGNEPRQVPPHLVDVAGAGRGELWALMLNQEETADSLIRRSASSEENAQRVLGNRIYRVLAGALASTEYMAVERLYQLYNGGQFDLYVLDTPPSKNALDFLDAPQWAARVLDRRIVHWFLRTAGRSVGEDDGLAAALMVRTAMIVADLLGRLLGREFYEELVEFFEAFAEMSGHLKDHSEEVDALLRMPSTSFFVACSPEQGAIEESIRMARALRQRGLGFGGFVVNRVEYPLSPPDAEGLGTLGRRVGDSGERLDRVVKALGAIWQEQLAIKARDEAAIRHLHYNAGRGVSIHRIPRLGDDLTGISDLDRFAACLVEETGNDLRATLPP
jgi:anion-transporting  ArsA/GET3 family ATPase